MIDVILWGILFIEYTVQQFSMFKLINIFLDIRVKKNIYYLICLPITLIGFLCDLSKVFNAYLSGLEILLTYKFLVTVIPEVILMFVLTRGRIIKKFFVILLNFGIIICLDAIAIQFATSSNITTDLNNATIGVRCFCNLFFTFTFVLITFILSKVVKKQNKQYQYKHLIIFVFFFISQLSLIILSTHTVSSVTDTFSISISVVSLITVIADVVIIQLIEQAGEKGRLEEQLKCIDEIQKGEKDYYENLAEKEEMMSKIRHDWNEQLQTALTLCADDSEKASKAKQIISELNESLLKSVPKRFTQNITLNALLNSKSKILEDADIKYKFDVQLKEKINIDLINLCSIFSNLINNAYEYSIKNIDNDNFIDLKAKQIDNKIIIKCTNSLKKEDEIIQKNDFKTTKADRKNHGYGLAIIKSLTEKYNGNMHIDIENNQFVANLYILENNLI